MFRSMRWFRKAAGTIRKPVRRPFFGAGRPHFRPSVEMLEDRQMPSTTAFSNLGGIPVQFTLRDDGHLLETRAGVTTDLGTGFRGLYQGKDSAGDQVAYDWAQGNL